MIKKINDDEIDLISLLIIIWNRKWIVIFFVLFALVAMYINLLFKKPAEFIASTEIRSITVYDEAKYNIYNTFINSLMINNFSQEMAYYEKKKETNTLDEQNLTLENERIIFDDLEILKKENKTDINNITKNFLLDLFIEEFNQKTNLIDYIKESNFISREDFSNVLEYENKVLKLASSIQLLNLEVYYEDKLTPLVIQFKTSNTKIIDKWEDFLKFIQKKINLKIQDNLSLMFENYVNYLETLNQYRIEDIDYKLSIAKSEGEQLILERNLIVFKGTKSIERMKNIFESSPLSNSDNFYAGKIIYDSTKYKKIKNTSNTAMLFASGVFGAIFGVLFALVANAIRNRR